MSLTKTAVPSLSAASVQAVQVLCIEEVRPAYRPRQRFLPLRHCDQMDVIAHQAVAQHIQPKALRLTCQQLKVEPKIIVHEEHLLAVVPALGDKTWNAGHDNARDSWHGASVVHVPCRGSR